MDYVIGDAIRRKIEEKGMTFVAFADKFGITDRNLQYFFKRNDISLQQITRASEILDYDFVKEYLAALKEDGKGRWIAEEPAPEYASKQKGITTSFTIVGNQDDYYKNFPDLLRTLISEASKLGFSIA
ncbi:hypothetical protein BDE36_1808 [Arcticibacter tournemirensis]|uniref:Uncharacterized protein n=1 Tax=Arcticibacter tournemirensis TaxID=699437 RepID=A0A5M9HAP2_9SPHI|nr:hypothetical protein [Arcticibacter tournemirensis]KAA8483730.1 hypothetical protein F1649_07525 [Arcticibacter tournemirensis]TQM50073.1 hypothetical protein BDE36_1808 [Arcticibacter tournemirensis]